MGAVQVLVSLHEGVYRIDDVPAKAKRVIRWGLRKAPDYFSVAEFRLVHAFRVNC